MGIVLTLISIEAARRVLGWGMALCAVLPVLYALFGAYLPVVIGHRGFTVRRIVEFVYLSSDGIFGVMAEVVAGFILPFVVFGAFMEVRRRGEILRRPVSGGARADHGRPGAGGRHLEPLHGHRER